MKPIRISIVEDNQEEREFYAGLLNHTEGFQCVSHHGSVEEAMEGLLSHRPDVVLMDIRMAGEAKGIECVWALKSRRQDLRIIMLTAFEDDELLFRSMQAGASGYVLKREPPTNLLAAIREVHGGQGYLSGTMARKVIAYFQRQASAHSPVERLSGRELEVLELLAGGLSYKEIASRLPIAESTVRTHIGRIYEKLNVHSRTAAAVLFTKSRAAGGKGAGSSP